MKVKFLLAIIAFFAFVNISFAKYTQTCTINYETQNGWSKGYTVDVHFYKGMELNTATTSFNYEVYSTYAVIFWGDNKATVIKLKDYLACGDEATKECVTVYVELKGIDQEDRHWKINTTY